MADSTRKKKAAITSDIHTIPNPMDYVQFLSAFNMELAGNTPTPDEIQQMSVNGMRELKTNVAKGKDILIECVQKAQEMMTSKKVPKVHVESMAVALMFLGYACVISNQLREARNHYAKSVHLWKKIHAANHAVIIPLACDLVNILLLTNSPATLKNLTWIVSMFDKNKQTSVIDALSLARVASVLAGQKGQSLFVPPTGDEKKIKLNPKVIHKLYRLSIARLRELDGSGLQTGDSKEMYYGKTPSPRSRFSKKSIQKEKLLENIKKALKMIQYEYATYKKTTNGKSRDATTTTTTTTTTSTTSTTSTTTTTTTTTVTTTTTTDASAPATDVSAPAPDASAPATVTTTIVCSVTATEGREDGGREPKPVSTPTT